MKLKYGNSKCLLKRIIYIYIYIYIYIIRNDLLSIIGDHFSFYIIIYRGLSNPIRFQNGSDSVNPDLKRIGKKQSESDPYGLRINP